MDVRQAQLGGPVHYADFGGEGPSLVLVHGVGGSFLNWVRVGAALTKHGRVLAPDLPGFGLSPPHGRTSLRGLQRTLERFIREVAGAPVTLFGNSLGGTIAARLAAESPELVHRLVLVNPAQPLPRGEPVDFTTVKIFAAYATPFVGERFLRRMGERLGPEGVTRHILARVTADPSRIPEDVVAQHIALTARRAKEMPWGDRAFLGGVRSLLALLLLRPFVLRRAFARIQAPTLVLQGVHDRQVPVAATRLLARARPDFAVEIWDDAGHVPQLEHPERFVATVEAWLRSVALKKTA